MDERENRNQGLKRIRLFAAIIAAFMFGTTGVQQFRAEAPQMLIPGVIITSVLGFVGVWVLMTLVIFAINVVRRGRNR